MSKNSQNYQFQTPSKFQNQQKAVNNMPEYSPKQEAAFDGFINKVLRDCHRLFN